MNLISVMSKLGDIVLEPVKLMTDWAREPLKTREHRRQMERDQYVVGAESEVRMKEASHASGIAMQERVTDAELEIRRKTEIHRIMVEIEELRKDNDFQRMKAVSDAVMQYQSQLTRLNVSAISAIGNMQLDLREKAQSLVYEKTIKYKEIQDGAHSQAFEEIMKIEKEFSGNESAKAILYKSVDLRLANMISTAQNFLLELNNDIAVLNRSINLLAEHGQTFVQEHLGQFHVIANGGLLDSDAKSKEISHK